MLKLEFSALQFLIEKKNQEFIINDSGKNLGATVVVKKKDVIKECVRQLYDINTYIKLLGEKAEMLIAEIRMKFLEVVNIH